MDTTATGTPTATTCPTKTSAMKGLLAWAGKWAGRVALLVIALLVGGFFILPTDFGGVITPGVRITASSDAVVISGAAGRVEGLSPSGDVLNFGYPSAGQDLILPRKTGWWPLRETVVAVRVGGKYIPLPESSAE